jgi:hypothetical protein
MELLLGRVQREGDREAMSGVYAWELRKAYSG